MLTILSTGSVRMESSVCVDFHEGLRCPFRGLTGRNFSLPSFVDSFPACDDSRICATKLGLRVMSTLTG
jgi:hypothetical protein